MRTVFGRCDVCRLRPNTVLFTEIMLLCWYDNSQGVFKSFSKWYSSIGKKLCPTTDMISSNMGQFCGTLSDYLQPVKIGRFIKFMQTVNISCSFTMHGH